MKREVKPAVGRRFKDGSVEKHGQIIKPLGYITLNGGQEKDLLTLRWGYDYGQNRKSFLFRKTDESLPDIGLLVKVKEEWYIDLEIQKIRVKLEAGHQLSRVTDSWD